MPPRGTPEPYRTGAVVAQQALTGRPEKRKSVQTVPVFLSNFAHEPGTGYGGTPP
jgi:hypothetical protein